MTNSAFGKQIQNRNFLSGVAFKFNLTKFPKVDFFSNSARIPELTLELTKQPSYLKNILSGQTRGNFDFFGSSITKKGVFGKAIFRFRHELLQLRPYIIQ